jgi:hypothetical protein
VSPKHALSIFEQYADPRKEIFLVKGDHNSQRPGATFNYVSIFFHRYLLPDHLKGIEEARIPKETDYGTVSRPSPLQLFGENDLQEVRESFYCKQVRGMDHYSRWPFNVVLAVGPHTIELLTPYTGASPLSQETYHF